MSNGQQTTETKMDKMTALQTEGYNTYYSHADSLAKDQADKKALDASQNAYFAADGEYETQKAELVALIGLTRAERAIAHFCSVKSALGVAKSQIASGKCKAA